MLIIIIKLVYAAGMLAHNKYSLLKYEKLFY